MNPLEEGTLTMLVIVIRFSGMELQLTDWELCEGLLHSVLGNTKWAKE
jgi:hypothetical protein